MANYFTQRRNDSEYMTEYMNGNKDMNNIILDKSVQENNTSCYASSGIVGAQSQVSRPMDGNDLDLGTKADIESKLRNQSYGIYSSGRNNQDYAKVPTTTPTECNIGDKIMYEDSRFTHPIANFREMETSQYNFNPALYVDFQKAVYDNTLFLSPSRGGESSRHLSKEPHFNKKPKEFAYLKEKVDFEELHRGLLPSKDKKLKANTPFVY